MIRLTQAYTDSWRCYASDGVAVKILPEFVVMCHPAIQKSLRDNHQDKRHNHVGDVVCLYSGEYWS